MYTCNEMICLKYDIIIDVFGLCAVYVINTITFDKVSHSPLSYLTLPVKSNQTSVQSLTFVRQNCYSNWKFFDKENALRFCPARSVQTENGR